MATTTAAAATAPFVARFQIATALVFTAIGAAQITMIFTSTVGTMGMFVLGIVAIAFWSLVACASFFCVNHINDAATPFTFIVTVFNAVTFFGVHACAIKNINTPIESVTTIFASMHMIGLGFMAAFVVSSFDKYREIDSKSEWASKLAQEILEMNRV